MHPSCRCCHSRPKPSWSPGYARSESGEQNGVESCVRERAIIKCDKVFFMQPFSTAEQQQASKPLIPCRRSGQSRSSRRWKSRRMVVTFITTTPTSAVVHDLLRLRSESRPNNGCERASRPPTLFIGCQWNLKSHYPSIQPCKNGSLQHNSRNTLDPYVSYVNCESKESFSFNAF